MKASVSIAKGRPAAFWSLAFRPFFLAASLWSAVALALWIGTVRHRRGSAGAALIRSPGTSMPCSSASSMQPLEASSSQRFRTGPDACQSEAGCWQGWSRSGSSVASSA